MADPPSSIANDPVAFLTPLVSAPPSKESLFQLAGPVAAYLRQEQTDPQVNALYLAAAAKHMATSLPRNDDLGTQRLEIVEAVGTAATRCSPRSTISETGILLGLQSWMIPDTMLTPAHVEFLHCSILAAQYRYARRVVAESWPRPMKASRTFVEENTLRYFYLRGLLHMGCEEWQMAIRCFWTAVSVPIDEVSAISIAAWKKLALCQCLEGLPINLPLATPNALSRFVSTPAESDTQNIRAYLDLLKAFTEEPDRFGSVRAQHETIFQGEGNAGMVERLGKEILHRRARHIASVYSVISLNQLSHALQVNPQHLPTLLSQARGLVAKVEPDGMVSMDLVSMEPIPKESMEQLMALTETIRDLDVALASTARYQAVKGGGGQGGPPGRSRSGGPRGVEEL